MNKLLQQNAAVDVARWKWKWHPQVHGVEQRIPKVANNSTHSEWHGGFFTLQEFQSLQEIWLAQCGPKCNLRKQRLNFARTFLVSFFYLNDILLSFCIFSHRIENFKRRNPFLRLLVSNSNVIFELSWLFYETSVSLFLRLCSAKYRDEKNTMLREEIKTCSWKFDSSRLA